MSSETRITYQELNQSVNQLAHSLLKRGVAKEDKIVIFMPNVLEFIISYFAVQRVGGIVVPINAKFTLPEVEFVMEHSDAKGIIAHELLFATVENLKYGEIRIKTGNSTVKWESFDQLLMQGSSEEIECILTEDDLSTILYTSGTTGNPKGVLFAYRNILTVANMIAIEMEMKPESRVLIMMPLSHSAPLHLFFMSAMLVGSTVVITPSFTPDLLLETVSTEKTTHFFGAPVAYLLTASSSKINDYDLSSMEWWVYGGAPLSKSEVLFISQQLNTDRLVSVYGLTEAGPSGSILHAKEHPQKAGSIGKRAAFGTELRIIDEEGKDIPIGEVGEIILFGEGNMKGYYKNEEATKATFINGWLKTGDLAKRDQDGYVWIVDRKKDVIISGGVTIYPKEIEDVVLQYMGVKEVAVYGLPHPEWGETVKLTFAATENIVLDELKGFLEDRLASYKIPRLYEQVEALPRNASGKILKQMLKKEGV